MCSQDKVIGEARAAGAIITDESSSYDDNKNGYFFSFLTSSSKSLTNKVLRWSFHETESKISACWGVHKCFVLIISSRIDSLD